MERVPMTMMGLEKLQEELAFLRNEKRPRVADDVARFRDMGDLRENADYQAAREELAMIDSKIQQIETKIALADIVRTDRVPTETVALGTRVTIREEGSGEEETFDLVGEGEADPERNRILAISPLAQALLTKKVGETAVFRGPRRTVTYKILKIGPQS